MPYTNVQKQQRWRDRRKAEKEQQMNEYQELLREFVGEFSAVMRFQIFPVEDEPDLKNPFKLRFVVGQEHLPRVAAFALERNLDVEVMFDRISTAAVANLKPQGNYFLVE